MGPRSLASRSRSRRMVASTDVKDYSGGMHSRFISSRDLPEGVLQFFRPRTIPPRGMWAEYSFPDESYFRFQVSGGMKIQVQPKTPL